ncbi:MAG: cysteine--1-D-myo-inosityl 2-amino-2-deoxy-alpha-D-glucopyranoside ligase [Nocardioidaceae bacterium]
MHAWEPPTVSSLPRERFGDAPALALFDTRRGRVEPTRPGDEARIYVCGITPYDATHLGHAATYVAFDLVVRAWRESGRRVHYVQNVTDIDDPLLERAAETGQDWRELADEETQLFREDMAALSVIPPDAYVGAVESMDLVVAMVDRLRKAGSVYDVDGDLYFSVTADPTFGSVSGLDRTAMLPLFKERGGDPDRPGKRDPLDCLLWQRQRPGEPGWESTLGTGRPGWHVECAAIAYEHLGGGFDVQGGGSDLIFPHHEMCAAEAQVAHPEHRFAESYVHAGMVGYKGDKMSKSLGNLVLVSRLRADGVDPRALRLTLMSQHYRGDWEWEAAMLVAAEERLERWGAAVSEGGIDPASTVAAVRRSLADDLDAPAALAAVDAWVAASEGKQAVPGSGEVIRGLVDASLGVPL